LKFYDCSTAPSPRRVRIFIAEKGLDIETIDIDLRNGEQHGEEFPKINPYRTVPVLELDDGTRYFSSDACRAYLEAAFPDPPLMGATPEEKAAVADANYHVVTDGFMAIGECLRNSAKGMAGRALTGPESYEQIPELAERGRARATRFMDALDAMIGDKPFLAGDNYSVADIDALIFVDFAKWVKIEPGEQHANLNRWRASVSARPSAAL
jgi:glutathione S-transferase